MQPRLAVRLSLLLCLGVSVAGSAPAQTFHSYGGPLSGAEVVPPSGSTAWASCVFLLDIDEFPMGDLCENYYGTPFIAHGSLSSSVQSTVTGLGLNRGSAGESGSEIVRITPVGYDFEFPFTELGLECDSLNTERYYFVLYTTEFPNGELRGQIHYIPPLAVEPRSWGRIKNRYRP